MIVSDIASFPQWRQTIIAAATSQLNSRYAKDAKIPKTPTSDGHWDCVQFVAFCYGMEDVPIQGTPVCFTDTRMTDYIRKYNAQRITLDLALPGDILFFDYSGTSHHCGLVYPSPEGSNETWMIHSSAAYRAVKAHPMTGEWSPGRRFHSVWSLAHLFEDNIQ
jgi:cell wall-associated NlpC family hydrolase